MHWLRSNHGALSASPLGPLLTEIQAAPVPEEHPQYWAAVQRAAVLGRSGDAQDLLGLHSGFARWSDPEQRRQVQPQVRADIPPCTTFRMPDMNHLYTTLPEETLRMIHDPVQAHIPAFIITTMDLLKIEIYPSLFIQSLRPHSMCGLFQSQTIAKKLGSDFLPTLTSNPRVSVCFGGLSSCILYASAQYRDKRGARVQPLRRQLNRGRVL